ncbi:MAG: T9SS type A sorting domain-containing protein [Bacteroidales bacterium]|jgi:hypothetical protein|nr:T9SS type A sorting domain-containing protein [Bacteroidales bacterium]
MKKLFFAVIATVCSLTAIGQPTHGVGSSWSTPHWAQYILPVCLANDPSYLTPHTGAYGAGFNSESDSITAVAQQYVSENPIKIIGIAALILNWNGGGITCNPLYLQIRQGIDDVLTEVRYDNLELWTSEPPPYFEDISWGGYAAEYIEIFFDSVPKTDEDNENAISVVVTDTFFAAATLHQGLSSDPCVARVFYLEPMTMMNCNGDVFPKVFYHNTWIDLDQHPLYSFYSNNGLDTILYPAMFLFPIVDTSFSFAYASVETGNAIVSTTAQTITLPVDITNFGSPAATQLGLVYGTDSASLYLATATNVPITINTSTSHYTHTLSASDVQCDTDYYYRAYIVSYDGQFIWGETKKFVYQCAASGSLMDILSSEVAAKLYPNPADKEITITTAIPMQKVEITNATGQKVYEQSLKTSSVKVNTSKFSSGSYIAKIHTEKGMVKKQFVVK